MTKEQDIAPYFCDNDIYSGGKWDTHQNHCRPLIASYSNLITRRIGWRFHRHAHIFTWFRVGNTVLLIYVLRTASFRCFFSSNIRIFIMTNLNTDWITRFRSITRDFVFVAIITSSSIITQSSQTTMSSFIHYQSSTSYCQHSMCFRKVSIEYKCHLGICLFDKSLWYCSNDRLVTNTYFHIDPYISISYL